MTHSPEPWRTFSEDAHAERMEINYGPVILNEDGDDCSACVVALKVLPTREDAERIVACVNFLAGFPTEMLVKLMSIREAYDHARTNLWSRIGDAEFLANRERRGVE